MSSESKALNFANDRARIGSIAAVAALCAIVGVAIASDAWLVVVGVLSLLATAVVLAFPRQAIILTIALSASELLIPEPSGQLRVFVLGVIVVVAWRALDNLWSGVSVPWTASKILLVLLMTITLWVMAVRGIGFHALGGSKVGGFLYVRLLATGVLALWLPGVKLSDAQWRRALVGMCMLAVLPLIADLTAVYVRGLAHGAAALFHLSPSVQGLAFGTTTDGATFRWSSAMSLSTYATLLIFLTERVDDATTRLAPRVIMGLLGAFALATLSGHRLAIVNVVGISAFVLLLDGRLTLRHALLGVVVMVVALAVASTFASSLPLAVQRSISWIPGVEISAEAGQSASYSVTWRVAVWVLALQEVPKYLWIGRGLAYAQSDATAAASAHLLSGEANWAIVQGYFHNGWLSLLILFGVVGLIVGIALHAAVATRHTRLTRALWRRPKLQRYHRVMTAWLLLQVLSYWLIYGDVQVSFPEMFFTIAVLEALRSDDFVSALTPDALASDAHRG